MTRDRALKRAIRARAARTGERYTAARRQLLRALEPPSTAPTPPLPAIVAPRAKSPISDAKVAENTGHGLVHWFDLLDKFGAVAKGHTAAARHLRDAHGIAGWYSQGITVAYERARGVRGVNQRVGGEYEVSVSKVVHAAPSIIGKALRSPRQRRRLSGVNPELLAALATAFKGSSKGINFRPNGLGTFRYRWGATTVQLYLAPRPDGKTSLVATNGKLESAEMVEERRAQWRAALNAVATLLAS